MSTKDLFEKLCVKSPSCCDATTITGEDIIVSDDVVVEDSLTVTGITTLLNDNNFIGNIQIKKNADDGQIVNKNIILHEQSGIFFREDGDLEIRKSQGDGQKINIISGASTSVLEINDEKIIIDEDLDINGNLLTQGTIYATDYIYSEGNGTFHGVLNMHGNIVQHDTGYYSSGTGTQQFNGDVQITTDKNLSLDTGNITSAGTIDLTDKLKISNLHTLTLGAYNLDETIGYISAYGNMNYTDFGIMLNSDDKRTEINSSNVINFKNSDVTKMQVGNSNITMMQKLIITDTTPSSHYNNGSFVTLGGMGVGEDLYVSGNVTAGTYMNANGGLIVTGASNFHGSLTGYDDSYYVSGTGTQQLNGDVQITGTKTLSMGTGNISGNNSLNITSSTSNSTLHNTIIGSMGGTTSVIANSSNWNEYDYGFQQSALGATKINSSTGNSVEICINDSPIFQVGDFNITCLSKLNGMVGADFNSDVHLLGSSSFVVGSGLIEGANQIFMSDASKYSILHAAKIGGISGIDNFFLSHTSNYNEYDFALLQNTTGKTTLNSKTGNSCDIAINNSSVASFGSSNITFLQPLNILNSTIGDLGNVTNSYFANISNFNATCFSLNQNSDGKSTLNSKLGQNVDIAVSGYPMANFGTSNITFLMPLVCSNITSAGYLNFNVSTYSATINNCRIGSTGASSLMYISHINNFSTTNFALRHSSSGGTILNTASGQNMSFTVAGSSKFFLNATTGALGSTNSYIDFSSNTLLSQINGIYLGVNTSSEYILTHRDNYNYNATSYNFKIAAGYGGHTYVNGEGGSNVVLQSNKVDILTAGPASITLYKNVLPTTTAANIDLGSAAKQFLNLYLVNAPTVSSDENFKHSISDIDETFALNFIDGIIPKFYKVIDSNPIDDELHCGFLSQQVGNVLDEIEYNNLLKENFSVWHKETWIETHTEIEIIDDVETEIEIETVKEREGLRYEEIISCLVKYCQILKEEITSLKDEMITVKNRVTALES